jgi:hypothetical protein
MLRPDWIDHPETIPDPFGFGQMAVDFLRIRKTRRRAILSSLRLGRKISFGPFMGRAMKAAKELCGGCPLSCPVAIAKRP